MSQVSTGGRFRNSLGLKAFVIVVLALLLLIPLYMVRGVIFERSVRSQQVAHEIAGKWAESQTVQGPFLVIPAERINPASEKGEMEYRKAVLLPDAFSAHSEVTAEIRSRGIFDAVVYTSRIRLNGDFTGAAMARAGFEKDGWRLRPDEAVLAMGISDLRGVQGDLAAGWDGAPLEAQAGMPNGARLPRSGIQWPVPLLRLQEGDSKPFEIAFTLRGSSRLSLLPVGTQSRLAMLGNWPAPSFDGRALPLERELRDDGFSARWDIFHLSRPLPQSWTSDIGPRESITESDWYDLAVGTSFMQPVDFYLLSERSVKYGLLIVSLLFLAFFLFEVLSNIALHPLQYLMVGAALVLFFLSLVALAEVVGFAIAYAGSSMLVIAMVGSYATAILRRRLWAGLLCMMIAGLYTLIYLILNLEEAALLAGTLVLFAALGLTMFVTRKVDWFNARKAATPPESDVPPATGGPPSGEAAL